MGDVIVAIWQVEFYFKLNGQSDISNIFIPQDSFNKLLPVLSVGKSWNDDLTVYGELDSTCVCVWKNSNSFEISCRLDVSSVKREEINAIIDFAKANNLMIVYAEQTFLPTYNNIFKILIDSPAFRFVRNPSLFLNNM